MIEIMVPPDTSKEKLWNLGPNYAADSVIIHNEEILLIKRADTGDWALPGGFIDGNEESLTAARREVFEETGMFVSGEGVNIFKGKVDDPRNSTSRWIETTAYLFETTYTADVTGNDDAQAAKWFLLDNLPSELYGSHRKIIERALLWQAFERGVSAPVGSGHMSYDYELRVTANDEAVFAKRHVAERHIDELREKKSRLYLEKEASMLESLRQEDYPHVPRYSVLYEDTLLAMEGLSQTKGWHWRAPEEEIDQYTRDCLQALTQLETVTIETDDVLTPSIISFLEEGWGFLENPTDIGLVQNKITSHLDDMKENTVYTAIRMRDNLTTLRDHTLALPIDFETTLSHHDVRQANIAWHAEEGVRLVDWSWAGPGLKKSDTTSLLIDLAKSGHDVSPYLEEYFNPHYAKLLIGFWLGHSILPSKEGNESVRLHQIASAATAYELLGL